MNGEILDFYADIHCAHIHAKGKIASMKLVELMDCKPGEAILEIGFGTGATLTYLSSVYKKSVFHGMEVSEKMYRSACRRLRFCGLVKRVKLHLVQKDHKIAFEESSFDKVYAESVLAIQNDDGVKSMIHDLHRILKPNGVLVFNETIWLDSTHATIANTINSKCLKSFGIIQSNAGLTYLSDWISLLTQLGFRVETVIGVNEICNRTKIRFNLAALLSKMYTLFGKMRYLYSRSLRREWDTYEQEISSIMPKNQKLMDGILLKATKIN